MNRHRLDANDIIGKKYSRLTILEFYPFRIEDKKRISAKVLCICECGIKKIIEYHSIKSGGSKSCGCLQKDKATKHGLSRSSEYHIWQGMHARCKNTYLAIKCVETISKYCSRKCRITSFKVNCLMCNKEFKTKPSKINKYCSPKCYWNSLKKTA